MWIKIACCLCTFLLFTSAQQCPPKWMQNGNDCYYFVTSELTWFDADHYCTYLLPGTFKVHLVSIETAAEHQAIKNFIDNDASLRERDFWTSGNKIDSYVGWKWSSVNKPFTYTLWAPGEPNDSGNCVQMWEGENHYWDDAPCDATVNFICEISVNETTTLDY